MAQLTFPADHDASGHVTFPETPTGQFLKDDGTWDSGGGGASFPVGIVIFTEDDTNPADLGIDGTWEEY